MCHLSAQHCRPQHAPSPRSRPPLPRAAPARRPVGGNAALQVLTDSESGDDGVDAGDLVSRGARLEAATGPAAAYLKPYQLVGINFLLLLYRQKVGGV